MIVDHRSRHPNGTSEDVPPESDDGTGSFDDDF